MFFWSLKKNIVKHTSAWLMGFPWMDWNRVNMTQHYIRYRIQLFPTIKKNLWAGEAEQGLAAVLILTSSNHLMLPHCTVNCLWSWFEIFHIIPRTLQGRSIMEKEKANTDLLARHFELWNIIQVESCPGELPDCHNSKCSQAHLEPYHKTQWFKSA